MKYLNTTYKRKSAIITTIILAALLFCVFNYGLKFLDPPLEYGIAIQYGVNDFGDDVPKETTKPTLTKNKETVEDIPKVTTKEKIITQDKEDAPVITDSKKNEEQPKPIQKKPSKEAQDAFDNLLKGNSSDGKPKGERDDKKPGIKGSQDGDPKTSKYYGNKGSDGDKNYNLAGRKALSKPIQKPDCQEEGTVVVRIEVDKNGKVIQAEAGVKGTTNSAPCLLKPAKEAALKTTWNPDEKAPKKQVGTIIYKFSLTE